MNSTAVNSINETEIIICVSAKDIKDINDS